MFVSTQVSSYDPDADIGGDADMGRDDHDWSEMEARSSGNLWVKGDTIRVCFKLGSDAVVRGRVRQYAQMWESYANIKFKFFTKKWPDEDSDVRIAFKKKKDGNNSQVGTNVLNVPEDRPTMNLNITHKTSKTETQRLVLHEFGYLLGCKHEHSSPAAKIKWNKPEVYKYYYLKCRWDEGKVDRNVLNITETTQHSRFDKKSIMLYRIPPNLTLNGFSVPKAAGELSPTDKSFIAMMYPPDEVRCHRCKERIHTSHPNQGHKCQLKYI